MNVFKAIDIPVFDNCYSKPAQMGLPDNAQFSMTVLFSVNGVIYYGQYNFSDGRWNTIPGDDKMRTFKDKDVEYWFYGPKSIGIFREYAKDVRLKKCTDSLSRLDEYVEDSEEESKTE